VTGKAALRQRFGALRASIPPGESDAAGVALASRVSKHELLYNARVIAAFASFGNEIPTDALINRLSADGRKVLLPRVADSGQTMVLATFSQLEALPVDRFGIRSPDGDCFAGHVDVVLLPGLAFGRNGGRLGFGAGFYDRLLALPSFDGSERCGVGYDAQVVDSIPLEAHDARLGHILTPTRLVACVDGDKG